MEDRFTTTEDKHRLIMQILATETSLFHKQVDAQKLLKVLSYIHRILGFRSAMAVPSELFIELGLLTHIFALVFNEDAEFEQLNGTKLF